MAETLTVPEAAAMIGVSRNLAYREIKESGELAGVRALRIGQRLLLPRRPLMRALGLEEVSPNGGGPDSAPRSGPRRPTSYERNSTDAGRT